MTQPRWRKLGVFASALTVIVVGCHNAEVEKAEHHSPAHKPEDYPAAITRTMRVHEEILAGPLVSREVKATHGHHHHHHGDGHGHSHSHDDQHVHLDALEELHDLIRWLPGLAADSDLKEAPWNRVNDAATALDAVLTQALAQSEEGRRSLYLEHEKDIAQHLQALREVKDEFPSADDDSASPHAN